MIYISIGWGDDLVLYMWQAITWLFEPMMTQFEFSGAYSAVPL